MKIKALPILAVILVLVSFLSESEAVSALKKGVKV